MLAASAADPMLAAGALTLSSHATAVVAKAAQPLQSALLLRGGRLSRPEYLHSVLLALVANAIAVHLCTFAETALRHLQEPQRVQSRRWRVLETVARHVASFGACLLAYLAVFHLTGFMPMGFVVGAAPAVRLFNPPS